MRTQVEKLNSFWQEFMRMWINKKLSELPETDQEIIEAEGVDLEAERDH